jgi:hypothetical protein
MFITIQSKIKIEYLLGEDSSCWITRASIANAAVRLPEDFTLEIDSDLFTDETTPTITRIIIGPEAFMGLDIEKVVCGEAVVQVQEHAFKDCSKLTSITFENETLKFNFGCFEGCLALQEIVGLTFDAQNSYLGYIFGATSVLANNSAVPATLSKIQLNSVLLPKCFAGCKNIKTVTLSSMTQVIPNSAFANCVNLSTLSKEEPQIFGVVSLKGLTTIEDDAFNGCVSFDTLFIAKQAIKFGVDCFRNCFGLVRVYNNTTHTDRWCYIEKGSTDYGCAGLYALDIIEREQGFDANEPHAPLGNVLSIINSDGDDEHWLVRMPNNENAYLEKDLYKTLDLSFILAQDTDYDKTPFNRNDLREITHIRNFLGAGSDIKCLRTAASLKYIGDNAFSNCAYLEHVALNSPNLYWVGTQAFDACQRLTKLTYFENTANMMTLVKSPLDDNKIFYLSASISLENVQFGWPQSIFHNIEELRIADRIVTLKTDYNDKLDDSGKYLDPYTWFDSGINALYYLTSTIDILGSFVDQYKVTFAHGQFFDTVKVMNNLPEIPAHAFYGCKNLKNIYYYTTNGIFTDSALLTQAIAPGLPNSVRSIGYDAFVGCQDSIYNINGNLKQLGLWIFGLKSPDTTECTITAFANAIYPYYFYYGAFTETNASSLQKVVFNGGYDAWAANIFMDVDANPAYRCKLNLGEVFIAGEKNSSESVVSFAEHCLITEISAYAFAGFDFKELSCLLAPKKELVNGVDTIQVPIGQDAFVACSINTLTCRPSMLPIFSGAKNLTAVNISPYINYTVSIFDRDIPDNALAGCASLTKVVINDTKVIGTTPEGAYEGITSIGYDAFANCNAFASITINGELSEATPQPGKTIWNRIFFKNKQANPLNNSITAGVLTAGSDNSLSVQDLNIYESEITQYTFLNFAKLNTVNFMCNLTVFDPLAFTGTTNVRKVTIAEELAESPADYKIETIDKSSFITNNGVLVFGCSEDERLELPESVTSIAPYALIDNSYLTSIVATGVDEIGIGAFMNCSSLVDLRIPFVGRTANETALTNCHLGYIFGAPLAELTVTEDIPNNLTLYISTDLDISLFKNSFYKCDNIKNIYLDCNLREVSEGALAPLSENIYLTIKKDDIEYLALTTAPIDDTYSTKLIYKVCATAATFADDAVQIIYDKAFANQKNLRRVECPSVVGIGTQAFYYCTALKWVSFGSYEENTINAKYIRTRAFDNCIKLATIKIGTSVCNVEAKVFYECCGLTKLTLPNTLTEDCVAGEAFSSLTKNEGNASSEVKTALKTLTMPAWLSSYVEKSRVTKVVLTGGNKIKPAAFSKCYWLREIDFVDQANIQEIGAQAFYQCASLVAFPWDKIVNSCIRIGSNAFNSCYNLCSVTLPKNLETWLEYSNSLVTGYYSLIELNYTNTTITNNLIALGNTFKAKCNMSVRILSNSACAIIYELSKIDDKYYITYHNYEKADLEANKEYLISFAPFASFPKANETERVLSDIIFQMLTVEGTWKTLSDQELKETLDFKTLPTQYTLTTNHFANGATATTAKQIFKVTGYEECNSVGASAFDRCLSLYEVVDTNNYFSSANINYRTYLGGVAHLAKAILGPDDETILLQSPDCIYYATFDEATSTYSYDILALVPKSDWLNASEVGLSYIDGKVTITPYTFTKLDRLTSFNVDSWPKALHFTNNAFYGSLNLTSILGATSETELRDKYSDELTDGTLVIEENAFAATKFE